MYGSTTLTVVIFEVPLSNFSYQRTNDKHQQEHTAIYFAYQRGLLLEHHVQQQARPLHSTSKYEISVNIEKFSYNRRLYMKYSRARKYAYVIVVCSSRTQPLLCTEYAIHRATSISKSVPFEGVLLYLYWCTRMKQPSYALTKLSFNRT